MKFDRIAFAVGGVLIIAAVVQAALPHVPWPQDAPDRGTIAAVVANIRESLADAPDDQREVIAGTSAALARWVRHDPPESLGDVAAVGRLAYRIGGWETGSRPAFSKAYGRTFVQHGLDRDVPVTDETAQRAALVLDSIAVGAR